MKNTLFAIVILLCLSCSINMVSAVDLTPNLYSHYTLNATSGSNAFDSSGYNRNGTTINSPIWVSGKLNNSINLDGAIQYIQFGSGVGNFERNNSFSFETWVNTTKTSSQQLFNKKEETGNYRGYQTQLQDNMVYFSLTSISGTNALIVKTNNSINISNGQFHHIIVTYSGTSLSSGVNIYVDNQNMALSTDSNSLTGTILNSINLQLGMKGTSTQAYQGRIDECAIYNKTINTTEVSFRYYYGNGTELMSGELPPPPTTTTTTTIPTTTTTTIPTTTTTTITLGNVSVQYCYDNSTLYKRTAKIQDNKLNVTEEYINCGYGCSDYSCNPSDFTIAIEIMGTFIGLIIVILIIIKLVTP
jgi:hypothetical protein